MLSNNMLQDKHMFIISKRTHKRNSLKMCVSMTNVEANSKKILAVGYSVLYLCIFSPVADCILCYVYVYMYFIPYSLAGQKNKYLLDS